MSNVKNKRRTRLLLKMHAYTRVCFALDARLWGSHMSGRHCNYFDMKVQTDSEKLLRGVCFSPIKHTEFSPHYKNKSPVKLSKINIKYASSKTPSVLINNHPSLKLRNNVHNSADTVSTEHCISSSCNWWAADYFERKMLASYLEKTESPQDIGLSAKGNDTCLIRHAPSRFFFEEN